MFIDVHTHLTHEKFKEDWESVINRAEDVGLSHIVVNGLEPTSNRQILDMASKYAVVKPALGIYPLDAVNEQLPPDLPFRVSRFSVEDEIKHIAARAASGDLFAVGECGLDGHWVGPDTFPQQEKVFEQLIEIAMNHDLPIIIHTRKLERRAAEILRHHGTKKVNFHCFGGRSKWAIQWADQDGWWFSIPSNARRNESFTKMLRQMPVEKILTETDAPYLGKDRGERSEPAHVVETVQYLSELRNWTVDKAKQQVFQNFCDLFSLDNHG